VNIIRAFTEKRLVFPSATITCTSTLCGSADAWCPSFEIASLKVALRIIAESINLCIELGGDDRRQIDSAKELLNPGQKFIRREGLGFVLKEAYMIGSPS
jgi:hypothetical protein